MEITYSKDYDGLIKELRNQIWKLEDEKKKEKLKFYSDNNISCDTCRYSWLSDVETVDNHTLCEKRNCMLCNHVCEGYERENETSDFLKKYEYEVDLFRLHHDIFDSNLADASLEKAKKFCEMYFEK